jgi:A/G-specific adenine glycosylase
MARKREGWRAKEPAGGPAERVAGVEPDRDPEWVAQVRRRLVAWYEHARRELPWRKDPDPYRILISETMLVQTTVAAVIPYYERFLARFPTVQALAEADPAEVLKLWEGLGYYRRARQLQAAARAIVEEHGGSFPDDPERIRALPGVGRYIAGALLSFAFDRPAPIVEANTRRVLARWLAWGEDLNSAASQARLWQAAERVVPPRGAGLFNQAFIELGALVCTPREPMCLVCPVAPLCRARALGLQDALPLASPKPAPLAVAEACALVERSGRFLIVQRGPGGLWEGLWEFPTIHRSGADPAGRAFGTPHDLAEGVRLLTGVRVQIGPLAETVRYSVTRHRVALDAYRAIGLTDALTPGPGLAQAAWAPAEALGEYPFGSAGRRLAARLAGRPADRSPD